MDYDVRRDGLIFFEKQTTGTNMIYIQHQCCTVDLGLISLSYPYFKKKQTMVLDLE